MSEKNRGSKYCLVATIAVLIAVAVGALFLIAPVWQPGYHAVGYSMTPTDALSGTNNEVGEKTPEFAEPIELNAATEQQLMQLSGIGKGKAAAIIEYRQKNGGFSDVTELAQIPGISQKMVESWTGQIYIAKSNN